MAYECFFSSEYAATELTPRPVGCHHNCRGHRDRSMKLRSGERKEKKTNSKRVWPLI